MCKVSIFSSKTLNLIKISRHGDSPFKPRQLFLTPNAIINRKKKALKIKSLTIFRTNNLRGCEIYDTFAFDFIGVFAP